MSGKQIYHYKKSRAQRAWLFIRIGSTFLLYIAGLYGYEVYSNHTVSSPTREVYLLGFALAAFCMFAIAFWLFTHPAVYEATITQDRFTVQYPGSKKWSFKVPVRNIIRFEYREAFGQGNSRGGIVLNDGTFFEISMNYGNAINDMYRAVKSINPDVTFSSTVNVSVPHFLRRFKSDDQ